MQQTTNTIVMVSPDNFQFNVETAKTNSFQKISREGGQEAQHAMREFEKMVSVLRDHQIHVIVLHSRNDVVTPDAVFPNNWFSLHRQSQDKHVLVLYPMLNENRRAERQVEALQSALKKQHIDVTDIVDLTSYENENKALEGTGSLVLDRANHIAYASLSLRTDQEILRDFSRQLNFETVVFHSHDHLSQPVYHTNVVMSIGSHFAVIALESIADVVERQCVIESLRRSGKEIIDISLDQMCGMAANILEVKSLDGKSKIVMSNTAHQALTASQRQQLMNFGDLVTVDIDVIERLGGGSARCMIAEVF